MNWVKQLRRICASILVITSLAMAQFPYTNFEIVESIPIETSLENDHIRNTSKVWLEMIRSARKTIDIEQFYISNRAGEALEPIIQAVENAASRNVRVRVIAENRMADTYPETLERLDQHANIEVRRIAVFSDNGGVQHGKYFIVDREQVFIGSQNFDWRALVHIHEIGFRIRHPEYAARMTELFELDWKQCETNRIFSLKPAQTVNWMTMNTGKGKTLRFFATASPFDNVPKTFREDLPTIIKMIDDAEKRVYIQLLSYSPSGKETFFADIHNALQQAAERGVDVRLLCSDWCQREYEMPYLKELVSQQNLDVKLSTIPQWSGGYISFARVEHCKMMIVDEQLSWLGSSNWKRNYFYGSRNVAVVVENEIINSALAELFLKSWNGPYAWRIDPEKEYIPKQYGEKD